VNKCANEVSFAFGRSKRVPACVLSKESRFPVNRTEVKYLLVSFSNLTSRNGSVPFVSFSIVNFNDECSTLNDGSSNLSGLLHPVLDIYSSNCVKDSFFFAHEPT